MPLVEGPVVCCPGVAVGCTCWAVIGTGANEVEPVVVLLVHWIEQVHYSLAV